MVIYLADFVSVHFFRILIVVPRMEHFGDVYYGDAIIFAIVCWHMLGLICPHIIFHGTIKI